MRRRELGKSCYRCSVHCLDGPWNRREGLFRVPAENAVPVVGQQELSAKGLPRNFNSAVTAGATLFLPSNASSSYCFASGDTSGATCERGSRDTSAPVSSNMGTS